MKARPRVLHEVTEAEKSRREQRIKLERMPRGAIARQATSGNEARLFQFKPSRELSMVLSS